MRQEHKKSREGKRHIKNMQAVTKKYRDLLSCRPRNVNNAECTTLRKNTFYECYVKKLYSS